MDPHDGRVLGFLVGFRSVVANQGLLEDSPGIVAHRRTVAVDFRVHPDLDELWLLPIVHICTPAISRMNFYTMRLTEGNESLHYVDLLNTDASKIFVAPESAARATRSRKYPIPLPVLI